MTDLAASNLLVTLSTELGWLADMTEGFHDLIGGEREGSESAFVVKAQAIDLATQVLADLADFCANLAADTPSDCRIPAAQALSLLRLADLRERLSSGAKAAFERQPAEGACELF